MPKSETKPESKTKAKKPKTKTRTKPEQGEEITLQTLLEAGCHFGHQSRRWDPRMKPYLYTVRDGVHVFDLVKTKEGLSKAAAFIKTTAAEGGKIIFVGTKRQAQAIIKEEAKKIGFPYVSQRWLGGTITNWSQIQKRIKKLAQMTEAQAKGEYKKYTKKEQLLLDREIKRLQRFFGGLSGLESLPDAVFIVDVKKEETVVREARRKNIPVVAIVDSNASPEGIDYLIPANDDAVGSIKLIVEVLAQAAGEGKEIWEKKNKQKNH